MNLNNIKVSKHIDNRGLFIKILKQSQAKSNFGEIYLIKSLPGMIRGNHYHKKTKEWFYLIKGKAVLTLKDIITNEMIKIVMNQNETIEIPVNIAHSVKNIGDDEMIMIAFADHEYSIEDTINLELC